MNKVKVALGVIFGDLLRIVISMVVATIFVQLSFGGIVTDDQLAELQGGISDVFFAMFFINIVISLIWFTWKNINNRRKGTYDFDEYCKMRIIAESIKYLGGFVVIIIGIISTIQVLEFLGAFVLFDCILLCLKVKDSKIFLGFTIFISILINMLLPLLAYKIRWKKKSENNINISDIK